MTAAPANFADRLLDAIAAKGSPVCVGLDPMYDRLPAELRTAGEGASERAAALERFCRGVIEAVAEHVPAVKPQIAYFELYGPAGLAAYFEVVQAAREAGLVVIGDAKRGDIGSTAAGYAAGHLGPGPDMPDALTVNGYFGLDGVEPFLGACRENGKGLFVLVRTSNPGGAAIQDFTAADGQRFFEHMGRQVAAWGDGAGLVGTQGYSAVGAVVGATYPDEARRLRQLMPRQLFLVPGYGAQGASAADCTAAFDDAGRGAIVNASRSVLYPKAAGPWQQAVAEAARAFAADIRGALDARA